MGINGFGFLTSTQSPDNIYHSLIVQSLHTLKNYVKTVLCAFIAIRLFFNHRAFIFLSKRNELLHFE